MAGIVGQTQQHESPNERQTKIVEVLVDAFSELMAADPDAFRNKFRKMAAGPFAFYRGSAPLFYADMEGEDDRWADERTSRVWIQGDLHAENFGTYMAGDGVFVFDVNDFDEAYLGEVIPLAEYQRRRKDLEQREEALASQERQLQAESRQRMELAGVANAIEDFCERVRGGLAEAAFEQKRKLVELLIDRVIVTGEEVEIRYVIPTDPGSEHVRFCHLRSDYVDGLPRREVVR